MKPIRLGVVFEQKINVGGGYQQALNAALLLKELSVDSVEVVYFTTIRSNVKTLLNYGISARFLNISLSEKVRACLYRNIRNTRLFKLARVFENDNPTEKPFLREKIDLVYFLGPSKWARDLEKLNYITTVWDLCHRDYPEFPEVRWDRQFDTRDINYREILPKAVAILVDSELSRFNLVRRYGLDEERIHVMPFQAAQTTRNYVEPGGCNETSIHDKYDLSIPYVFYPAQFWAHKNHIYLLEGLKRLDEKFNLRIGAIFSGGDFGNLLYVRKYVAKLGLNDRVRFAGFVSDSEVPELYRQSLALVMPTYFGPTNLPPLEAFQLGVPVLYPDKLGLRDQVGDAALLMDLKDPGTMAEHLKSLIADEKLRDGLIQAGRARLEYFESLDRIKILRTIIEEFRWKRACWD